MRVSDTSGLLRVLFGKIIMVTSYAIPSIFDDHATSMTSTNYFTLNFDQGM